MAYGLPLQFNLGSLIRVVMDVIQNSVTILLDTYSAYGLKIATG